MMKKSWLIILILFTGLPVSLFSGDHKRINETDCLYWFEVNHGISTTVMPIAIAYLYLIPDSNGNGWPDEAMFPGTPPYSCDGESYVCAIGYRSVFDLERIYINGQFYFRPAYGASPGCVVWRDY